MNNLNNMIKLKDSVNYLKKGRLYCPIDENERITKFKPWLGDSFSFLYDRIMEYSIFPKKFTGSISKHFDILKNELQYIHNKNIIEVATGSGDSAQYLNINNRYIGTDISSGLLKIASKRFETIGFKEAEFYITDACELPFEENHFDLALCNLSLNFFEDIEIFIAELKRILTSNGVFYCSIPVKNRLKKGTKIRGNIYFEDELKSFFISNKFVFTVLGYQNGAVLYFKAICQKN